MNIVRSIAVLLVAGVLGLPAVSAAQTIQPYTDAMNNFDPSEAVNYGYLPNVPGSFTSFEDPQFLSHQPLEIGDALADPDFNNTVSGILGCAALDDDELMIAPLENGLDGWARYVDTHGWQDIVTKVFGDAQSPHMFMALEQYASNRARMTMDRCAALQGQDQNSRILAEAVQTCVNGRDDDSETVAQAYFRCLNSPAEMGSGLSLTDSVADTLTSARWAGSLHDALARTNFCFQNAVDDNGNAVNEPDKCYMLSFLPNTRWCTQGTLDENGQCSDQATNPNNQMSVAEAISPQTIFDLAFALSQPIVKQQYDIASVAIANAGAGIKELARTADARAPGVEQAMGLGVLSPSRYEQVGDQISRQRGLLLDGFYGYSACSSQGLGPDFGAYFHYMVDTTTGDVQAYWQELRDAVQNTLGLDPSLLADFNEFGARAHSFNMIYTTFDQGGVGSSNTDLYTTRPALELIGAAVLCSAVHDMRLSFADFLKFVNTKEAGAAMLAYRGQLAYMATLRVMDYIRYRLQMSRVQMSFSHISDPHGFAPHMRRGVDHLIAAFDSRIEGLKDRGQHKSSFARAFSQMEFTRN